MPPSARIVIASFGTLGDLNPYLAIAAVLKARGHHPVIATSEYYHRQIEDAGLEFHPTRPNMAHSAATKTILNHYFHSNIGVIRLVREVTLPSLEANYADLLDAVRGADLLVSSPTAFAAPIVSAKSGVPWISTVHTPSYFNSAFDRTVPRMFPPLGHLNCLGLPARKTVKGLLWKATRSWYRPFDRLRTREGLPPGGHPFFEGLHSPSLVLALFSSHFASPQPDWPPHTCVTGFPLPEATRPGASLPAPIEKFLADGPPPVLFTLGTSAALFPHFFRAGVKAALRLGVRAMLLGKDVPSEVAPAGAREKGIALFDYAPYSLVFPRASVVVHHGGIGTTGLALRAGRPMLVTPQAHDHFDNAARVTRAGVGESLLLRRFTAGRAARKLRALLSDSGYASRATEMGANLRQEDGTRTACDAIERFLTSC